MKNLYVQFFIIIYQIITLDIRHFFVQIDVQKN